MHTLKGKWIALSFVSGCAVAISGPARPLAASAPESLAVPANTASAVAPAAIQDWVAVESVVLEQMRGGFDIAPGLKVSFGIERLVNLNGILQTATRIEVPDAGKLVQMALAPAAAALPTASSPVGASAASARAAPPQTAAATAAAGATAVPLAANLGNGAVGLIQNGLGNTLSPGPLPQGTLATFIQNSMNNQTIQSMTVINAATNSLELLKGANLQSTLFDALTQSARAR